MRASTRSYITITLALVFGSNLCAAQTDSKDLVVVHVAIPADSGCGEIVTKFPTSKAGLQLTFGIASGNNTGIFQLDHKTGALRVLRPEAISDENQVIVIEEYVLRQLSNDSTAQLFQHHAMEHGVSTAKLTKSKRREYVIVISQTPPPSQPVRILVNSDSTEFDTPPLLVELCEEELYEEPKPLLQAASLLNNEDVKSALESGGHQESRSLVRNPVIKSIEEFAAPITEEQIDPISAGPLTSVVATEITPPTEDNADQEPQNLTAKPELPALLRHYTLNAAGILGLVIGGLVLMTLLRIYLKRKSKEDNVSELEGFEFEEEGESEQEEVAPSNMPERMFMAFKSDEDVERLRAMLTERASVNENSAESNVDFMQDNEPVGVCLEEEVAITSRTVTDLSLTKEFSDFKQTEKELEVEAYEIDPAKKKLLSQTAEFRLIANSAANNAISTYWAGRFRNMILWVIGASCVSATTLILLIRDMQNVMLCSAWSVLMLASFLIAAQHLRKYSVK